MTCNLRTGHGHGQNPLLHFVSLVISLEYVKLDVTNLVWRLLVENTIVSVIEYCTTECAQDHMTPQRSGKYISSISRKQYQIETQLQVKTNKKSYVAYWLERIPKPGP